jgi:MFS family permease
MNIVIKILILSDFIINSVSNLIAPVFAIFIVDMVPGATVAAVGIATALYLICKSVLEVPIGIYVDKKKGEKDDFYTAFFGSILSAGVYFLYPAVNAVWHLYALQIILGVSSALSLPGWLGIFSRHLDKKIAAFEWSVYDVFAGVGMALAAFVGAFMVDKWGFDIVFYIIGIFSVIGAFVLLMIKDKLYKRR